MAADDYDINFYFDPVCPFAWLTSRWVNKVAAQKDYRVDWRFISLRLLNSHIDYDAHFPENYEDGHNAGLFMLRVCAAVRAAEGRDPMGPLYTALSSRIFDIEPPEDMGTWMQTQGNRGMVEAALSEVGLPMSFADALDDASFDPEIQAETDEALALTGKDVGTPIIAYRPPDGPAFFGPVISNIPSDEDAVPLWDSILHLTSYSGFSELKRSLRAAPALRVWGGDPDKPGEMQDWHGGSRRLKK